MTPKKQQKTRKVKVWVVKRHRGFKVETDEAMRYPFEEPDVPHQKTLMVFPSRLQAKRWAEKWHNGRELFKVVPAYLTYKA